MSTRYGVELVFDPAFTFQVYRTRQAVCAQYACWAAEMHMLRMQLVPYFECPESSLDVLDTEMAGVAAGSRDSLGAASFDRTGVSIREESGGVMLDLSDSRGQLGRLYEAALAAVARTPGAKVPAHSFHPGVALLEYGGLIPAVLQDAAAYAVGTMQETVHQARAWRLMVLRYTSEAAGGDWSNGRWANDVGWKQLYTYSLA